MKYIAVQPKVVGWLDARRGPFACVEIPCIRFRAPTSLDVLIEGHLYWLESAAGCCPSIRSAGPNDENISTSMTMVGPVGWSDSAGVDVRFLHRAVEAGGRTFRWS